MSLSSALIFLSLLAMLTSPTMAISDQPIIDNSGSIPTLKPKSTKATEPPLSSEPPNTSQISDPPNAPTLPLPNRKKASKIPTLSPLDENKEQKQQKALTTSKAIAESLPLLESITKFWVKGIVFFTDRHYRIIPNPAGSGAYGAVAVAHDLRNGAKQVAIKKISKAFYDLEDGKRALREVKMISNFHHPNVSSIHFPF